MVTSGGWQQGMIPGRDEFAGRWTVARRIADAYGAQGGVFDGVAVLVPDGKGGLIYDEEGVLRMGNGPAMTATRRYLWAFDGQRVSVSFADGRPFHVFVPSGAGIEAKHDCAPDLYHVTYDFSAWPRWQARWRVVGPRKDYAMVTDYAPAANAGDA